MHLSLTNPVRETPRGLLLRKKQDDKLSWTDTYKAMAHEDEEPKTLQYSDFSTGGDTDFQRPGHIAHIYLMTGKLRQQGKKPSDQTEMVNDMYLARLKLQNLHLDIMKL